MNRSVKLATSLLFSAGLVFGVQSAAQAQTVEDGVFTQAQVDSGKVVYDASCKSCHNMRFYRDMLRSWNSQPLLYLWENILGTMPADNPGSLMYEEYTDVIAYILHEQGFPTGDTPLDPDNGMEDISIVAP
jgi:mono/diheme cytochrome c family protein